MLQQVQYCRALTEEHSKQESQERERKLQGEARKLGNVDVHPILLMATNPSNVWWRHPSESGPCQKLYGVPKTRIRRGPSSLT